MNAAPMCRNTDVEIRAYRDDGIVGLRAPGVEGKAALDNELWPVEWRV